jgi:hypothetical protein
MRPLRLLSPSKSGSLRSLCRSRRRSERRQLPVEKFQTLPIEQR